MTFTYDLTTLVGKIRNLIADVDSTSPIMYDEEITAMLNIRLNDLFSTAALCLRRIAANKALTARLRKAGNFTEDNRQIAQDLLKAAQVYEDLSVNVPADAQADVVYTDFNYNQLILNRVLNRQPLDNF